MGMKPVPDAIRLPMGEEPIGPVTILDGQGRVVRIVTAADFRRDHTPPPSASSISPSLVRRARSRGARAARELV
jgi:hypothetical protein